MSRSGNRKQRSDKARPQEREQNPYAPPPPSVAQPARVDERKSGEVPGFARGAWAGESRVADIVTIGWLFTTLTTFLASVATIVLRWYLLSVQPTKLQQLAFSYLVIFAMICGALTLLLGFAAGRLRKKQAPRSVKIVTTLVGLMPLIICFWYMLPEPL